MRKVDIEEDFARLAKLARKNKRLVKTAQGRLRQLGGNIGRLRQEAGYGQRELAAILGLRQGAISNWETGKHLPSLLELYKTQMALGVTWETLLG